MSNEIPRLPAIANPRGEGHPAEYHDIGFSSYVRHNGSLTKVAEEVGVSRDSIERWARKGDWAGKVERAEHDLTASAMRSARQKLRDLAPKALAELERQLEHGETDWIKQRAAIALLDRFGLTVVKQFVIDQRSASLSVHATLDPDTPPPTTEEAHAILLRMLSEDTSNR